MIRLHTGCLVFEPGGELIPCSGGEVVIELVGEAGLAVEPELVRNAAAGVLEYYRREMRQEFVSAAEFCEALAAVLRQFGLEARTEAAVPPPGPAGLAAGEAKLCLQGGPGEGVDLRRLACESGKGFELVFFARLREELERQLSESPNVLWFNGLRSCVKQLAGARRWSRRCQELNDQIVDYLRACLGQNKRVDSCAMVVV